MYDFDGRMSRAVCPLVWITCAIWLSGCDDPTRVLDMPAEVDRSMTLIGILDPDSTMQPLGIGTVELASGSLSLEEALIDGLVVEVFADGEPILRAVQDTNLASDPWRSCFERYSSGSTLNCIHLHFRPTPGETYTIRVSADDRPTATAVVRVPGAFDIGVVNAAGHPPGTDGLSVDWSRSPAAYRYLVALRASDNDCEYDTRGCPGGWYAVTADTTLETVVPRRDLRHGSGSWFVDVYALDRALYEYLTTGTGGEFFSIPPTSNVDGGHGVVGAWVRRSYAARS